MYDNKSSTDKVSKNNNRKRAVWIASFVLAAAPVILLLMVFLFCLLVSVVAPDAGVIWWLFIAAVFIFIPVAVITDILSVILGIIGLRSQKTIFAWAGIIIVSLEVLAAFLIWRVWG